MEYSSLTGIRSFHSSDHYWATRRILMPYGKWICAGRPRGSFQPLLRSRSGNERRMATLPRPIRMNECHGSSKTGSTTTAHATNTR